MNRLLYSILVTLLTPVLVIYLMLRSRKDPAYRLRWRERFGIKRLASTEVLIHAVSMGETLAALPLIRQLLRDHPQYRLTLTSTSPTGSAEIVKAFAAEIALGRVQHVYLPFDIPWAVARFVRQVAPQLVVIMETELWPNLVHYCNRAGAKVVLANARLSAKSANQYQQRLRLIRPMLQQLAAIAVQTDAEAARFIALGVDPDVVTVCGSLKFDLTVDKSRVQQAQHWRQQWQRQDAPVWVAGSVHPGEFTEIIAAHQQVLAQQPNALMIMVPRHPEQFDLAAQTLAAAGLSFVRRSEQQAPEAETQVILGDTMGELLDLYACADQAFVGGSLIVHGGHNPLEPAALGLAVYMGPNFRDFLEITELLRGEGNLTLVTDGHALGQLLLFRAQHPRELHAAAKAGQRVLANNRGALTKQLTVIEQQLRNS
ncbi:lipid IV(A) 3-deoxy-D-manno-octulosonic acid transferase [Shewanella sp. NIFS-20-20]|uniref:lipid IV(A) 3-deoxy-D-manno-octulosonic acid transferase n=1 Tax=Shewanella sp. NIFS-20-20 TaxID=2853806 RepID=UPI001C449031|nr:lipid IV(A) 3-deoxy-D-manno-octulosonic acid transferase [Shewanella sp. NIFS-20-20]MBV7316118.1 lipid IV(A) 3-deoxy-D-manno-octulosonic acid transferase [Shewanella sp. NIFS-20-20]